MPTHGALLNSTVGKAFRATEDAIPTTKKTKANKPATKPAPATTGANDEPEQVIDDLGMITLTDSAPEDGVVTLEG